jgi:hypothetical protein
VTDGGLTRFSLAGFVIAAVTVGLGTAAGLAVIPIVGSYLGMLLGGFAAGLANKGRPVLEAGFAGILANLGVLVAGSLIGNGLLAAASALGSIPPATLPVPVVLGFAVGALGAHLGDDLRDGLTEPTETPPSGSTSSTSVGRPRTEDESSTRETREDLKEPDNASQGESTSHETHRRESDDLELERE